MTIDEAFDWTEKDRVTPFMSKQLCKSYLFHESNCACLHYFYTFPKTPGDATKQHWCNLGGKSPCNFPKLED